MPEARLATVKNGCEHHPDCDTCPLATCYAGRRAPPRNPRRQAKALARNGHSPGRIAVIMSVSTRTVYRYLRP